METSGVWEVRKMLMHIIAVLLFLPGSIIAVANAIRDDPPMTISEKTVSAKNRKKKRNQ